MAAVARGAVMLTISDVAERLHIEKHTASLLIRREMRYIHISERIVLVDERDFDAFISAHAVTPKALLFRKMMNISRGLTGTACKQFRGFISPGFLLRLFQLPA